MQTECEGLWLTLEEHPEDWTLMLVLADWYEDHNQEGIAKFLRWARKQEHFPLYANSFQGRDPEMSWDWRILNHDHEQQGPEDLPKTLWEKIQVDKGTASSYFKEFFSVKDAFLGLYAAWEKGGEVK